MTSNFCHLHCHSYYSLMDGLNSPLELCQAAKDLGQSAIAVTDHGTLSSHRDFQRAAKQTGVKPVLGVEAYVSATDRFDRRQVSKREDNTQLYNHLVLLAKDADGYKNLSILSEVAWTEGFYYKPRIDQELLELYGDGLIVLSGCLNGLIAKAIEHDDPDEARRWLEFFKSRFGDDFYIEVQAHNPDKINQQLIKYADAYGVGLVATSDCHYARKHDAAVEEALLILSTSPKTAKGESYETTKHIEDIFERLNVLYPDRSMSFEGLNLFVNDRDSIAAEFASNGFERDDMFDNTQEIVDKVGDYEFHRGLDLLPTPAIGKNDPVGTLRRLVNEGLKERGLWGKREYRDRAREELQIISDKNFYNYFLIVSDLIRWARRKGIRVGPGRGSAAGSLVCYALGITEVDPLEFDLLFFRFINPERNDFPDIDLDFQKSRRAEVKEYLRKKYGHVASIATFTYFKDKNVIKDAARVLKVPLKDVELALKKINKFQEFESSSLEEVNNFKRRYPEVLPLAKSLKDAIRSGGMHPGGTVVSKEPIERYAPIETRTDPSDKVSGRVVTVACDKDEADDIGLIKLDLLGLATLDVIDDAIKEIESRHGVKVNLPTRRAELNDPKVFELLSSGETVGLFQADQQSYTSLLKEMKVESFDDLVASNALVRPGARNTVGQAYIDRQYGREHVRYLHPILEPITKETYGVIIYQEQVMQAANKLGDMSMSDADKLRKIIGKKRDVKEFEQFFDQFMDGATQYVDKARAEALWHDFEAHADYSFNKSHAVAYSMLSYHTAWLKLNYPLEFIYALLKNEGDKDKTTEFLIEAKRRQQRVKLPHINSSDAQFTIDGDSIRFGLNSVKYISDKVSGNIIAARPYSSYQHFLEVAQAKGSGINSRAVQALNAVGAAAMHDNPRTGKEPDNYYEYLNIPQFSQHEFPDEVNELVTPLSEYDEDNSFVVKALVKKIKVGTGWSILELVDETGTTGVFYKESADIPTGQIFFLLIAGNRVVSYASVDEVANRPDEPTGPGAAALIKYLWEPVESLGVTAAGEKYIVGFERRRTKAGKTMGTAVACGLDKSLRRVLIFPRQFAQTYGKVLEGQAVKLSLGRTQDGTLMLNGLGE